MLNNRFLFLCLLLQLGLSPISTAAGSASAVPEELASFLGEIETAAARVQGLTCAFTQEKHLALFARPVIFHGTLDLVRPDRLRWEFTSPVPSVLIFKNQSGLRCNGQAPPVRFDLKSDPVMQMVARQLWLWLDGNYTRLSSEYHLQLTAAATLVLVPRNQKLAEFIATITISFDQATKQPQRVAIAEPGGDLTIISFHDYQLNPRLDETLFDRCGGRE